MMGLAQAGTIVRSGDPLMVQGVTPSGLANSGQVMYRFAAEAVRWELLTRTRTTNPTATTTAIDTTGANLLVAVAMGYSGTATVTDSNGNTWTRGIRYEAYGNVIDIMYCINPTVGAGHTFQISGISYFGFVVLAFNVSTSPASDQTSTGSSPGGVATVQLNPLTPAVDNSLIITAVSNNSNINSVDSGFNLLENIPASGATMGCAVAYLVQQNAATVQPTWSFVAATGTAASMISFKPS